MSLKKQALPNFTQLREMPPRRPRTPVEDEIQPAPEPSPGSVTGRLRNLAVADGSRQSSGSSSKSSKSAKSSSSKSSVSSATTASSVQSGKSNIELC